jgi:ubiquinone/menaquinone biosynthesis C-methylase UbiE
MEIDHYSDIPELRMKLEQRENLALEQIKSSRNLERTKILDLGCGDGCFLSQFLKENCDLYGFDLSVNQLKKARVRLPQAHFTQGSLSERFPFEDNFFDSIYCGEVLEHLVNTDHFVKEAFRVLKPGGTLTMTTPNLFAWYNRLFMLFGISPLFLEYSTTDSSLGYGPLKRFKASDQPVGHLRIFHPEAFREIQTKYGFQELKLSSARFEYLPTKVRWLDDLISQLSVSLGSILISTARKPLK